MEYNKQTFKKEFLLLGDEKCKNFAKKIGVGKLEPIGIKSPVLKTIAKQLASSNWQEFLEEEENFCAEVVILKGLCLGYAKIGFDEFLKYLKKFFEMVESWAETDMTTPIFKIIEKHREEIWNEILPYLFCGEEYKTRLAIVILLDYFLTDEWIDKVLDVLQKIGQGQYYVDMALAWTLSVSFVKYREKTLEIFKKKTFSKFVQNKAIQKCRESFRVQDKDKQLLISYKL